MVVFVVPPSFRRRLISIIPFSGPPDDVEEAPFETPPVRVLVPSELVLFLIMSQLGVRPVLRPKEISATQSIPPTERTPFSILPEGRKGC